MAGAVLYRQPVPNACNTRNPTITLQRRRKRQAHHRHQIRNRAKEVHHPQAETVGKGARPQGQPGAGGNEHDDDPLHGGQVGVKGVADGGQGHVDRKVQRRQRHAQRGGRRQGDGAPGEAGRRCREFGFSRGGA